MREVTKKEAVAELRKAFNSYIKTLPDVEYYRVSSSQDGFVPDEVGFGYLHTAEFGAE